MQVRGDLVGGPGVGAIVGRAVLEPASTFTHTAEGWAFAFDGTRYTTRMPGRHNAENALLAVALCRRLGAAPDRLRDALARFTGVHRRLEVAGSFRGAPVIDDYAHNPAKIAASWRAVREQAHRVLGYWRPHGFAPLALMHDELVAALAGALGPDDRLFVLPVFYAGGTAKRVIDAPDFVAALRARGLAAECVPDYAALRARLAAEAQPGDAILGMGARDPELPRFARSLAAAPTPDT